DLPEEFSHLQAQDMGKLGFMQDLIRGIRKILNADEEKPTVVRETVVASGNANVQPLLKRAFMFLEDGDFKSADEYCEKVLDIDPENGHAYLGKLMAELKVKVQEKLKDCAEPFDESNNYQKAVRYGDKELAEALKGYVESIKNRNEENRLKKAYDEACKAMNNAKTEEQFKDAAEKFGEIKGYRDSDSLCESCYVKAEESRKSGIYDLAKKYIGYNTVFWLEKAVELFESIADYEDAGAKASGCKVRIEELEAKAERKKKRAIKITKIASPIVAVLITFIIMLNTVILPKIKYNNLIKKYGKETVDEINSLQIGDIYIFGTYEQDNDVSNGKEEIEWQVLAKEDYRVLLISKYALDCVQYNSEWEYVTWETCTLRKWLNETFINSAFNSDEQALIPETNVSADKNPKYSTNPGNATKDKIFLLSISEVNKYFLSDDERMCAATDYAKAQGAYISDDNTVGGKGACWWWLRSPGHSQHHAADVYSAGSVYRYGDLVNYGRGSVRPALWITLES
ncbi:MAG: DUF6273 domain-containing protein, partial [Oscillospiraceae bacterium]|nr:DUF6273 domain-containing protein [Oscillospiraceae bacterium]